MSNVTTYNNFRHSAFIMDEFHVMILKRLALNPGLNKKPHEVGMTRYKILEGFEEDKKGMSQETTLNKTKELENYGLIAVINEKRPKNRPLILTFDLTLLGFAVFVRTITKINEPLNVKKVEELISKSSRLIPGIVKNWSALKGKYTVEKLFESLANACDIHIIDDFIIKGRKVVMLIEVPVRVSGLQVRLVFPVVYSKLKKEKKYKIDRINYNLSRIVTFLFFYNLIPNFSKLSSPEFIPKGTSLFRFRSKKIPSVGYEAWENRYGKQVKELLEILKQDKRTFRIFLDYLRILNIKTYDSQFFIKKLLKFSTGY